VEQRVVGVVSVEHDGRPANQHDGVCLTLLVTLDTAAAADVKLADDTQHQWLTVSDADVVSHLDAVSASAVALRG